MIKLSGRNVEPFVRAISSHISPEHPFNYCPCRQDPSGFVWNLGASLWRAVPVLGDDGKLCGIRLENPERTLEEIAVVERAITILQRLDP